MSHKSYYYSGDFFFIFSHSLIRENKQRQKMLRGVQLCEFLVYNLVFHISVNFLASVIMIN
jgi:hypothetical protein